MIAPNHEDALSIRGPVYVSQSAPSSYNQITCFARRCRPELDGSFIKSVSDERSLRTVRGQAPLALGIDLRRGRAFPIPHVEMERL
jgi:hypothetical protein